MSSTPVTYATTFKISELFLRQITHQTSNGIEYSVKCPCFHGTEGLEVLFAVINYFIRAAQDDLHLVDTNGNVNYDLYFAKFKNVLNDIALIHFENSIISKDPNTSDHTKSNWEEAIKMLKRSFAGGSQARDNILEYISSSECSKPMTIIKNCITGIINSLQMK